MSTADNSRVTQWQKSTFSNTGDCVEMRRNDDRIEVRDSKDPEGPTLKYTHSELEAFIKGAKAGEFDHLV